MREWIREVKDFPKPGIVFRDIFPLLEQAFPEVIDELAKKISHYKDFDYIAGIESRGFIFAAALAYKLNKGFIPIRKKGKLPPPTKSIKLSMEYADTELEMAESPTAYRPLVIIVDDVLATGETMKAAWNLCSMSGYSPIESLVLIRIKDKKFPNYLDVKSLFDYEQ